MVNIIKVVHKDNVRRLTLSPDASWIDLEAKLRPLFHIPALTPFTLSYTDEDNDVITLSTDIELREILTTTSNVKFNLKFSSPDDLSDSEDSNSEVWVLEGRDIFRKKDASIETDNPVLSDNVSPKNIISTTNQEPQYDASQEPPQYFRSDKNETSPIKKPQVNSIDDDFEKVENSPTVERPSNDSGKAENPSNDFKKVENPSNDLERSENPSNDVERTEEGSSKVLRSPIDLRRAERLSNHFERTEGPLKVFERTGRSQIDFKGAERPSNEFERTEGPSKDFERTERSPIDFRRAERSSNEFERTEGPSKDFERTERSPIDFRRAERSSNEFERTEGLSKDFERTERPSGKKTSLVNLLDDDFFESLTSYNITPTFASSKPKPIPIPQSKPQYEFNDTEENLGETVSETSSSTSNSLFHSTEQNQEQRPRHSQNPNTNEPHVIEQFKIMIDQYENLIKEDPKLTASIKDAMEQIRTSIPVDQDSFPRQNTRSQVNKHNFRQQRSLTPPIPGYTRSPTPPRHGHGRSATSPKRGHDRSSTPPRRGYGRSSTPPRRGYGRSSTPPRRGHDRSITPPGHRSVTPPIPGSYPSNTPPSATPCLWINEPNTNNNNNNNNNNGRGRGRRGRGRGRNHRNNNQKNRGEESPERVVTPVTPERGVTPERVVIPERKATPEPQEVINSPYYEQIKLLNSMGYGKYKDDYEELLQNYEGSVEAVVDIFCQRD